MSFFDFLKKKEIKTELVTTKLNINELKEKVNSKIKESDDLKSFSKELNAIKKNISELKKANDELLAKEADGEYSKALLIGVNNAKKALCTMINAGLSERTINSLTDLSDYLSDLSKLINNSHTALKKYSNAVNMIYKKEMLGIIEALDSLNQKLANCLESIKNNLGLINDLRKINDLIREKETLDDNNSALRKELEYTNASLKDNEKNISKTAGKLSELNKSDELKEAKKNESVINELNNELNTVNYRANTIMSYLSKILKSFRHNASSNLIESLNEEPLKTISEQKSDFQKLRESILSELKNKHIELKDKQEVKAKQAIESDELANLANRYQEINDAIKKIDLSACKEKKDLELNINELTNEKQELIKKINSINEKIKSTDELITDLVTRISEKSSETLNLKICIINND